MKPADFIVQVRDMARDLDVDPALVVLGGDHLGPQVWRGSDAVTSIGHAADPIRASVEAWFPRIHSNCYEGCTGDPAQVDQDVSAIRATCEHKSRPLEQQVSGWARALVSADIQSTPALNLLEVA